MKNFDMISKKLGEYSSIALQWLRSLPGTLLGAINKFKPKR